MAADILIQGADIVPVGQDQKQHIEIARDTAEKFNRTFGETFKPPEPLIIKEIETIPGTDGQKMSKSYKNTIGLFAEDEEIKKGVMSIPTDSKGVGESKDPENCNVFALHKIFSQDNLSELERRYREGGIGYKESKEILIANISAFITPLREKRKEISKDKDAIIKIIKNAGEIAREKAMLKMREVKDKIGVNNL